METQELPRIGNRSDALALLEQLIKIAKTSAEAHKALSLGLEALKDVIDREAI
ncbi:MAG: hypothetical protein FWG29_05585 [Treponema sp.]|nr:hypothetical protein [Treponema sp.]